MNLLAMLLLILLILGGIHFPGWEKWGWNFKGMHIAKWDGKDKMYRGHSASLNTQLKLVLSMNIVLGFPV